MIARIAIAVGLVALGAAAMFVYLGPSTAQVAVPSPTIGVGTAGSTPAPAMADMLMLTPEAVRRAGIAVAPVVSSNDAGALVVPGVVEPDGYRTVAVTPIVGGTVVSVSAALGDVVTRDSTVARLRSPELTDEVRRWLSLSADLDVVTRRLTRTRDLAKIGAASQQELEEVEADSVRATTDLATARARLIRLGLDDARMAAVAAGGGVPETIDVQAGAGGVVLTRPVNPGQNVGPMDTLMTLADVSSVWIMADIFERDAAHVRAGERVAVTSETFPGRTWTGRVSYVDPELARDTRTVRARVEVSNPDGALRFGMFVIVTLRLPSTSPRMMVPQTAVQMLGAVPVVYVEEVEQPGHFTERPVVTGVSSGDRIVIRSGLLEGERVVVEGSFFLRAERERLGWPPPVAPALDEPMSMPSAEPVIRRVVEVTASGLTPPRVEIPAFQPVDLVFVRRVEETCGTEVLIPGLGVRRELPLNQEVVVRIPARAPGELAFACGMDMLKGVIVVR